MDRRAKIILGVFAAVLITIIVTEIVRPKPINWRPSYYASDKIPFGCHVLFNELTTLFPEDTIQSIEESPYETLAYRDQSQKSNYIFINNYIYFDEEESRELLDYVSDGNSVFIAATDFGGKVADTLNLQVASDYTIKEDTLTINLTNTSFPKKNFLYARGLNKTHFTSVDTVNTTILGHLAYEPQQNVLQETVDNSSPKVNFIKVEFGAGNFYLNTTPQAFSNYYILRGNQDYVAHALSYIGDKTTYWDNYKKSGRRIVDSPMRFVLNQISLKWAYYLTMLGLLVFVIFRAKREQRIIPVIEPLKNSSVEFARTVGSLYYQHKDYTDLISKKLNYFLEYIRSHYYMDTSTIDDKTAKDLAAKSGKALKETKELIDFIIHLKNKTQHSEQDVIALNKKIDSFKK
ncbi:hypothetical protein GGR42_000952 [Saonia flava]|uniref:DUF4350 domain-containing protein n=1 Tax=Saonia flava TaxID=523696 RepID=A0A846QU51_9FLAO|nr:DUF4350 domain-containing protein [Saonia flava]NJB70490.1 hypothetical protein [Saonia flava]